MFDETDTRATVRRTEHDNDDVTHVCTYGVDDEHVVVAIDIDEELAGLEAEIVAVCATAAEATKRAERWCENNPKGVLGDRGLSGMVGRLTGK